MLIKKVPINAGCFSRPRFSRASGLSRYPACWNLGNTYGSRLWSARRDYPACGNLGLRFSALVRASGHLSRYPACGNLGLRFSALVRADLSRYPACGNLGLRFSALVRADLSRYPACGNLGSPRVGMHICLAIPPVGTWGTRSGSRLSVPQRAFSRASGCTSVSDSWLECSVAGER